MISLRVWSPDASSVRLVTGSGAVAARRLESPGHDGWWEAAARLAHGDRYAWSIDGGEPLPDPRAVWLPDGVHRASAIYDHHGYAWNDSGWAGRPWDGAVVYELHVGTFSVAGTLDGVVEHLDHLVALGVTHVELLPVASWDGPRGWGYDGAGLWSVHEAYGGPDGLKRLVDACHACGLAVLLDVVHNHLGPSGNYLARFAPYFTDTHSTPWGAAVNLDAPGSDEVRDWIVGSVLSWLRDFHLDGLRLDAVHELRDDRAVHLLEQLSTAVDALAADLGRPLVLVAESDRNDPRTVTHRATGGLGVHVQWSDDFHHAVHALLTGEAQGYYADFAADPWRAVATVLTGGFFHADTWSSFRGRRHGRPLDTSTLPGNRLLAYTQNHDQVGNRARGERLCHLASSGLVAAGAALVLTSPFTPMLFMGEEWAASTPWLFFTSYPDADLGAAVTAGRRREFGEHGWTGEVPDPQDPATFERSRLDWDELTAEPHRRMLDWYVALIRLRAAEPDLRDPWLGRVEVSYDAAAAWLAVARGAFQVAVNLGGVERVVPLTRPGARVVLSWGVAEVAGTGILLGPESTAVLRR